MKKLLYTLLIILAFTACKKDSETSTTTAPSPGSTTATKAATTTSTATGGTSTGGAEIAVSSDATFGGTTGSIGGTTSSTASGQTIEIQPGQITSGEWNDLDNWNFWNTVSLKDTFIPLIQTWDFDIKNRFSVILKDGNGKLIQGKKVELIENETVTWTAETDNYGKAELWGTSSIAKVKINNNSLDVKSFNGQSQEFQILHSDTRTSKNIDIAFVVDATGSMGDEVEFLKTELIDVVNRIKANNSVNINIGSVYYRDKGDDYVTRYSQFTNDANSSISFMQQQSAGGGGDFPEAVHSGLDDAINKLQWKSTAYTKIIFLLLDAPPHKNQEVIHSIHTSVKKAAEMGIKIIPITASGIDKETEFLMRYMAIATNGTYTFVTNHSGIGGNHIEPTIGDYQVEFLNDLLVRLIEKYIK